MVASRSRWVGYENGNYTVALNLADGTKIRRSDDDFFDAAMPESMDVKISDRCSHGCPFCHEGSTPDGKLAPLAPSAFVAASMHPYTEVAVGGGNLMENIPHTEAFLHMFAAAGCIPSVTVRQPDFIDHADVLARWRDEKLVYGIGVSLSDAADPRLPELLGRFPTAVLHVIAGVLNEDDVARLTGRGLRMLVLGYKDVGRGSLFLEARRTDVEHNIAWLASHLEDVFDGFSLVSFDNLALEQLPVRDVVGERAWESFYMGDDGTATFYIDLVEGRFARSSSSSDRRPIARLDESTGKTRIRTVNDMFAEIKREALTESCREENA